MSVYTRHCAVDLFAAVGYAAAMGASRGVTPRALEPEVGAEEEDADVDAEGSACAQATHREVANDAVATAAARNVFVARRIHPAAMPILVGARTSSPASEYAARLDDEERYRIMSRQRFVGNFEAIKLTARANARRARTGEESCRIAVVACWRRRMRSRFCFSTAR